MYKKLILFLLSVQFISCASSGILTNNKFKDSIHKFSVTFPKDYKVSTFSGSSEQRVHAYAMDYLGFTRVMKPNIEIIFLKSNKSLDEFVISMNEVHYYAPRAYFGYKVAKEQNMKIKNYPTKLLYFTSGARGANKYTNLGTTAYIKINSGYIIVEYITYAKWFNEKEFLKILNSFEFENISN